jgi:hypothetical protein
MTSSRDFAAGLYLHLGDDDLPGGSVAGDLVATRAEPGLGSALLVARPAMKPAEHEPGTGLLALRVPTMPSPHATCECSWIRPPSRARRRTRMLSSAGATGILPSGGCWLRARWGRRVL